MNDDEVLQFFKNASSESCLALGCYCAERVYPVLNYFLEIEVPDKKTEMRLIMDSNWEFSLGINLKIRKNIFKKISKKINPEIITIKNKNLEKEGIYSLIYGAYVINSMLSDSIESNKYYYAVYSSSRMRNFIKELDDSTDMDINVSNRLFFSDCFLYFDYKKEIEMLYDAINCSMQYDFDYKNVLYLRELAVKQVNFR